jgi:hypothetical protein
MVGANGFEPSTSWSRTRRASQAALRPDRHARTLARAIIHNSLSQHFRNNHRAHEQNGILSLKACHKSDFHPSLPMPAL